MRTKTALLILVTVGFFSQQVRAKDIVDTASEAGNFKTLVAAVQAAGLVDTLKSEGPFTVFAPTDEAFAQLPNGTLESLLKPENQSQLRDILTYHVAPGRVDAQTAFGLDQATTVNGQRALISTENGQLSIGNAKIVITDLKCSNGIIHVIDSVLLPNSEDLLSTAEHAGNFKTLLAAIEAAGLDSALSADGPFTVLAPTDDAFAALPQGTVESLLQPENKDKLQQILKLHVVPGRVYQDQAAQLKNATALSGSELKFRIKNGGLQVNEAAILATDLDSSNGVIHVIDRVLLPPALSPAEALRTLERAVSRGAPIFNHGDAHRCQQIYREACLYIIDNSNDSTIPANAIKVLRLAIEQADAADSEEGQCWALRNGIDLTYQSLSKMTTRISRR